MRAASSISAAHFASPPNMRAYVDLLERLATAMPALDLTDEQQERCRVLHGGVHADGGLRGARAARDEADARAPGQLAVGLGGVGGARLVPAHDQSAGGRDVVKRVEHGQVRLARHAERHVCAVHEQLVDEHLPAAARSGGHGAGSATVPGSVRRSPARLEPVGGARHPAASGTRLPQAVDALVHEHRVALRLGPVAILVADVADRWLWPSRSAGSTITRTNAAGPSPTTSA